jgi:hypothetical protein
MAGNPKPVPPIIVRGLTILLALGGIVAFAWMFGWGIYKVWFRNSAADSEGFVDVATAVAALVGGIVAVGFSQPSMKPATGRLRRLRSGFRGLGAFAAQVNWDWEAVLGGLYAIIYVLLGILAVVTWVAGPADPTPPLIKNLATTFLGLALPIITAFFLGTRSGVVESK